MFEEVRKVLLFIIIILIIIFIFFIIKNEKERTNLIEKNIIANIQNKNIERNLKDKIEITKKIYVKNTQQEKQEKNQILLIQKQTNKNLNHLSSVKLINNINTTFSNFSK